MGKRFAKIVVFYVLLFLIIAGASMMQAKSFRVCYNYDFNSPYLGGWAVGEMFCPNDAVMALKTLIALVKGIFSAWPIRYALVVFLTLSHSVLYLLRGYI